MKKILFGTFVSLFLIACNDKKEEEKTATATSSETSAETKKAPTDILDNSEANGVRAGLTAMTKKDVSGLTADYDDNAHYYFSGGDSLIGKQAITNYWNGRMNIIDSINFSEIITLPIRINESQSPKYATVGKWVLTWTLTHVKYKNGKWIHFWVHTDYYYNDAGKINTVVQYLDFHPIREATKDLMK